MGESYLVDPSTAVPEPRFHPPGDKVALSASTFGTGIGIIASSTVAAGATGVQHVATGVTFSMATTPSVLATTTIGVRILDGSTMIWGAVLSVGSNGISPPIHITGLNLLGSAATAMTAGFDAATANATQFVSLQYHDIGQ